MTPDLQFAIERAEALRFAASPHIAFTLRVTNSTTCRIHTIILKCQIQLDVARRRYSSKEQERMLDLFGEPGRWGETLRSMLWTNTTAIVPAFEETTAIDLQVPCTFDFNVAATKYFAGIESGDIPIAIYFSGTIFYAGDGDALQAIQVPWDKETSFRLPVQVWREMMDLYYPNSAWLCLRRDTFERICSYKVRHGIPTFDDALIGAIGESKAALGQ